ncbi:MAG: dienelactone hydrolase family protein [Chloroflexi bacterium]|nr:dienelactone hydrolase family protein [Chloroflexota bacterium]
MTEIRQDIMFPSGDLALEGTLHLPAEEGRFPGVVICHPHPRYGGDMYNVIVATLAQSLCAAGIAALRFNFRGVDMSEGSFDGGNGEIQDAEEALNYLSLSENVDASRVGIAGYSFGAAVAMAAASRSNLAQAIVSVACPSRVFNEMSAQEMLIPKLLILGEHDHDFPAQQFKFMARRYSDPKQVEIIDGADHFFGGHVAQVVGLATTFFEQWLGEQRRQP